MARSKRTVAGLVAILAALCLLVGWLVLISVQEPAETVLIEDPAAAAAPDDAGRSGSGSGGRSAAATRGGRGATGNLTGEVRVRLDRTPSSGRQVRLIGPDGQVVTATTGADGVFVFEDLPRRTQWDLELDVPGFGTVRRNGIRLGRHRRLDIGTLWLAPSVDVRVEVFSSDGEPVEGASVEAFAMGRGATAFESGVLPRAVTVARSNGVGVARFSGLATGDWQFVASARGFERRGSGTVQLAPGTREPRFRVVLSSGARLTGRVVGRDGEPIPHAELVAHRRGLMTDSDVVPISVRARSRSDGTYVLEGLPTGDIVVWATRGGGALWVAAAARMPGVERLDLTVPDDARVFGVVTHGSSGEPMLRAPIRLAVVLPIGITSFVDDVTDDYGRYSVAVPGGGRLIEVEVESPGYFTAIEGAKSSRTDLNLAEGEDVEVNVVVVRGTPLKGRITSGGDPVWGAVVSARHEHETRETTTDRRGRYEFSALRPGQVRLHVDRWGYTMPEQAPSVQMPEGVQAPVVFDVDMKAGGSITGSVFGPDGVPVVGAEVCVVDEPGAWCATTDDGGRFEMGAATPGAVVWLVAEHDLHVPAYHKVTLAADGGGAEVRIDMQRLTRVRGTIRSASGEPLRDAYVQIAGTNDGRTADPALREWGWLTIDRVPVSADGTFDELLAIVDPQVVVRAVAAGHAPRESDPVTRRADDDGTVIDVVLRGGEEIRGVVRDSAGRTVAGRSISVIPGRPDARPDYPGAWGPPVAAVTDKAGKFVIRHLSVGSYIILVRPSGGGTDGHWVGALTGRTIEIQLPDTADPE